MVTTTTAGGHTFFTHRVRRGTRLVDGAAGLERVRNTNGARGPRVQKSYVVRSDHGFGRPAPGVGALLEHPLANVRCVRQQAAGTATHACDADCNEAWFYDNLDQHARVELRATTARQGLGVGAFALSAIPRKTILGLYTGRLRSQDRVANKMYMANMVVPGERKIGVDALEEGSWLRFINHHCDKNNCVFEPKHHLRTRRVNAVKTIKDIAKGAQLLLNYGDDYFLTGECMCGSKNCLYIITPEEEDTAPKKKKAVPGSRANKGGYSLRKLK